MSLRIAPDTDENGTQHYSLFGGGQLQYGEGNHGLPEQADATAHPLVMLAATMLATDWFCKTTCAKKKTRKLSLLAMRPADRGDWPTTPMQQVPLGSHSLFAVRDMLKSSKHPDEWTGQITPRLRLRFLSITSIFQPQDNSIFQPQDNIRLVRLCVYFFLFRVSHLARDSLPRRQQARRESFARMIYSYLFVISSGGCGWCRALGI